MKEERRDLEGAAGGKKGEIAKPAWKKEENVERKEEGKKGDGILRLIQLKGSAGGRKKRRKRRNLLLRLLPAS